MSTREPRPDESFCDLQQRAVQQIREDGVLRLHEDVNSSSVAEDLAGVAILEGLAADLDLRDHPALEIGKKIGGYVLTRQLGAGAMGVVYEARQESLDRRIAIKILTRSPDHKNLGQRFRIEAKTTSTLDHPNVVSTFDYGIDGNRPWLAMPIVDGISLDRILENGAEELERRIASARLGELTPGELRAQWIARLGSQVADALAHAHENGIVHRDIKPGNLILDAEGKVWVTDFGLAKIRDVETDLSKTGDMIGTPTYMAPEQVRGIVDPRSDIYSLGVTLWELCTGQRAWESAEKGHVLDFKLNGVSLIEVQKVNPNVPSDLAHIIMKACAYNPDERYQTAKELQHVLNRFAHGEAVSDRRKRPRDPQPRPWLRRHFIAAGFVAALLAGGLVFRSSQQPEAKFVIPEISVAGTETALGEYSIAENESSVAIIPEELRRGTLSGDDASLFELNPQTGELRFIDEPDFEVPVDRKHDNIYELTVTASKDIADLPITICVNDIDEPVLLGNVDDPQAVHLRMRKGEWSVRSTRPTSNKRPGIPGSIPIDNGWPGRGPVSSYRRQRTRCFARITAAKGAV